MFNYFESLLPEVHKRWAAVRLVYFNQSSTEAKKAWAEIEGVVGKCPEAQPLSSYFANVAGKIRRDKMRIHRGSVKLFRELEVLRAQAETERERGELQFALVLAKQHTDKTPIKQLIRDVARQLPDNVFVKNQLAIEKVVWNAKGHRIARSQKLLSRSQMVYLH